MSRGVVVRRLLALVVAEVALAAASVDGLLGDDRLRDLVVGLRGLELRLDAHGAQAEHHLTERDRLLDGAKAGREGGTVGGDDRPGVRRARGSAGNEVGGTDVHGVLQTTGG